VVLVLNTVPGRDHARCALQKSLVDAWTSHDVPAADMMAFLKRLQMVRDDGHRGRDYCLSVGPMCEPAGVCCAAGHSVHASRASPVRSEARGGESAALAPTVALVLFAVVRLVVVPAVGCACLRVREYVHVLVHVIMGLGSCRARRLI
jgi:hypothetical protein